MATGEKYKEWRKKCKDKGFVYVGSFVPAELAEKMKQLMREWKAQNPQQYINSR